MEIIEISQVTDEIVAAFNRLIPQLSSNPVPTRRDLESIVASQSTTLLAARDASAGIVGLLCLVTYRIPTSHKAWIEDVVVDEAYRGRGIGEALTRAAMQRAQSLGCTAIDLTSNPSRVAANRLYQRLGFQKRSTNYYRYHW
jgi:ribosomal protein S18 acetylase RimI-like enzyme